MKGNYNEIREGDALQQLKEINDETVDLIVTDPPYGYSFMGKEWDKAVVSVDVWRECLRVLKAGAFAFIMSAPRQDVLSRMIVNLQDAGFRTDFTSIYWSYASGFPKAANVSKLVDKRNGTNMSEFGKIIKQRRIELGLSQKDIAKHFPSRTGGLTGCVWNWEDGKNCPTLEEYNKLVDILKLDKNQYPELQEAEREIIETKRKARAEGQHSALPTLGAKTKYIDINYTKSSTEAAKRLDGSYAGFQPKPALEIALVVMKPLSQKSFVDQALNNGKGVTWLDDCRIPYKDNNDKGRFPANLLVSDDALNDGKITKSGIARNKNSVPIRKDNWNYGKYKHNNEYPDIGYPDSGSYSRYFDLDKWYDNNRAQFIITPKASASERNKGLESLEPQNKRIVNNQNCKYCPICSRKYPNSIMICKCGYNKLEITEVENKARSNYHPTVKPLKLMSYLITMGSRENDVVLDPFCGSGTTLIAAHQLNRRWIGIELNTEYAEIARKRIEPYLVQQKLL